jgi:hypothetical protein
VAELNRIPAGERWPRLRARAQHHRQQLAAQDQEQCEVIAARRRTHHAKQLRIIANVATAIGLPDA